jgi:homoserine O-succinyltransferase
MLMDSPDTGPCLIDDPAHRHLYMFNHIEYDSDSLREEYARDSANGDSIPTPHDYFPLNDPAQNPENRWRSHAHLLFANWINEIYQTSPFDLTAVGSAREKV